MRINKYLATAGVCSRREADRFISQKKVSINGRCASLGDEVSDADEVLFCGREIKVEVQNKKQIILAFNKPEGYLCSTDTKQGKNIYELIDYPARLFYVGRLDKMSRGLLLLTNDGEFANNIMRPQNQHEREYIVTIDKEISVEFLEKMRNGIYLPDLDVKTKKCQVNRISNKTFSIILTQGLNRQIRRMCEACGVRVRDLCRVRIENISLGNLKEGTLRKISGKEKESLLAALK